MDISQIRTVASGPLHSQANVSLGSILSFEFQELLLQAHHPLGLPLFLL